MKKLLKFLFFLILTPALIVVGVATYFGFMPVLSDLVGTNKPKNLGVIYTEQNFADYQKKAISKLEYASEPKNGKSLVTQGTVRVQDNFSAREISARINYSKWKDMPIKNVQVRLNEDGTVEFSANLAVDRLQGFIKEVGGGDVSQEDIKEALKYIDVLASDPPVYLKFIASVQNNKSEVTVQALQIGKFSVPLNELGGDEAVSDFVDYVFRTVPGFYVESASFSHGQMNFTGTVPERVFVQTD